MKFLKKVFYFLGGLYFAITLIISTAIFVLAGTLIEARTESHLYASYFTYNNPLFLLLLWGFFVNILLSTLRRWPFKANHIPFIITHIGLLMILGGVLTKSYMGIQGSMGILEGSGSDQILVPNSYSIALDKKNPFVKTFIPVSPGSKIASPFPELTINLLNFFPHALETMEVWPESKVVDNVSNAAEQAYIASTQILLRDNISEKIVFEGSLADLMDREVPFATGSIKATLHFNYSTVLGFSSPCLNIDLKLLNQKSVEKIKIPLDGENSLHNFNLSSPYLGALPLSFDIKCAPSSIVFKDTHKDIYLFVFDPFGRVYSKIFRKDNFTSIMEYDNGFGGYTLQANVPKTSQNHSRIEIEKNQINSIMHELKHSLNSETPLSPPLKFLQSACEKAGVDFSETCITFLREWNYSHGWLFPNHSSHYDTVEKALAKLDWEALPLQITNGSILASRVFHTIEQGLKDGQNLLEILTLLKWPLVNSLISLQSPTGASDPNEITLLLTHLIQQLFSVGHLIPEFKREGIANARLLSAFLRLYEIHWNSIEKPSSQSAESHSIETPIRLKHLYTDPSKKIEDNSPTLSIRLSENGESETITLSYDRFGMGLKWPVLNGKYRVRFQPLFVKIPYRIRLRQARQINYPNSSQPYSYESDLIVTDSSTGKQIEKTISMNNVLETWDGYRFYLANIVPADKGSVKRVQLVVNFDPAKYWLTYPGCLLLVLGIILLFWFRKSIIR